MSEILIAHIPVFLIDTRWPGVWDVSPKSTSLLLRRVSSPCSFATSLSCKDTALQLGQTRILATAGIDDMKLEGRLLLTIST